MSPLVADPDVDRWADRLAFDLPPHLEAGEPPEARGLTRDGVRMLVAHREQADVVHSTFALLPAFLEPGDLVVVNTSGTIPAAVDAVAADATELVIHLSTRLDAPRDTARTQPASRSAGSSSPGDPTAARPTAGPAARRPPPSTSTPRPAPPARRCTSSRPTARPGRLWVARLELPQPVLTWLAVHGRPIRYGYVDRPWPITAYQNVYATEPGSAEMPSAGRPFTPEVLMRLVAKGIGVTPLVLHTGVASLEADELPYPERVIVPA